MSDIEIATILVKDALRRLEILGGDLECPELDLEHTPERIVRMWVELTSSLRESPPVVTTFKSDHDQMLILRGIDFVSLCSHHFAPFRGKAHVAYIPKGRVVGISKPARVIDYFAARPQTQELLTRQVTDFLKKKLKPQGIMVVIEAEHTCISCRGASKPGSKFITSDVRGAFLESAAARDEFLKLIGARNG